MESQKIHSFTDLRTWKEGHKLVLMIYTSTRKYPNDERYCLIDQTRRAVISITSNIAEGFSRFTKPDKKHFYYISLGSLTEVQNLLLVAKDQRYISNNEFQEIAKQTVEVSKLLNSLIKSISRVGDLLRNT